MSSLFATVSGDGWWTQALLEPPWERCGISLGYGGVVVEPLTASFLVPLLIVAALSTAAEVLCRHLPVLRWLFPPLLGITATIFMLATVRVDDAPERFPVMIAVMAGLVVVLVVSAYWTVLLATRRLVGSET